MTTLDHLLFDRRDAIVRRFVAEVQGQDVPPTGTSKRNVVDHIPSFLDDLIRELRPQTEVRDTQDVSDVSSTARRHGVQRWELGFDLDALVREYGVLRHCILMEARDAGVAVTIDEFDKLAKCLNVGVAEAVTAFTEQRNAERDADHARLQFVAEAGTLLSSSLDTRATVTRLARMAIPRLADWCAIHLVDRALAAELPVAHVDPAKADLVRALYESAPLPADSPAGYARVIATGETELVCDARAAGVAAQAMAPAHRAALEALGTVSWIIVPLRVQRATFGAITLAYSDSGRHHEPSDAIVAEDIAKRAAVAIENANLYEMSIRERSRVEAATRAKDEFVAMISHELRTPLNAILGWSRLLRSGGLPPEKHPHAIEVIERNADAQSQLVGDLLDVSKIIRGTVRINPALMDLSDVVEMAIEGVRPGAEAKRITLETRVERANTLLRGDADRLRQVVWNLLTNAVKFTPKGGRILVTLRPVDSDLELVIEDNGVGIPAAFLSQMFDSFRQLDSSATRPHGGLGVGLSIAKHFVTLHGGSLEGFSEGPGTGARFVVRLPVSSLVSTTVGVRRGPAVDELRSVLPRGLQGLKVLVVDDDADARELLQAVLEECGVVVRLAPSADAAWTALEEFQPDVMISDIGMPGGDGYGLIHKVRASSSEAIRRTPAIALTAYAAAEDRNRALLAGFNLHATKPADPGALATMVADLAGRLTAAASDA